MKTVSVQKGLDIPLAGAPVPGIETGKTAASVAVVPDRIPLVKPRLRVKTGDTVKIGSLLFEDKKNPKLRFLSPGGGIITDIAYGHRRAIARIVVETAGEEESVSFSPVDPTGAEKPDRDRMVETLMERGLWPLIRSLPYRTIASSSENPSSLWVSLDSSDPFQVPPALYLKGNEDLFTKGIRALERLGLPVFVCENKRSPVKNKAVEPLVTHRVSGPYPAEDPGVVLYHTKKSADENRAWYIMGQDLLLLAEGLLSGKYPTSRIVAVSGFSGGNGQEGEKPCNRYVKTRMGIPLASLVDHPGDPSLSRWVTGGILRGSISEPEGYLGFYETSLIAATEPQDPELFGFLRPGRFKPTASRAFLYALHKKPLHPVADIRGEERACINCGKCEQVCPVDIMVQFAYKSIYAGETEEALAYGLLDCVECGLCSYVCPAKIELADTLAATRRDYYQERI